MSEKEVTHREEKAITRRFSQQVSTRPGRPCVQGSQLFCVRCQKPVEEHMNTAAESRNHGKIYIFAACHGAKAQLSMTYREWHDFGFEGGKRIDLFEEDRVLPEPPQEPKPMKVASPTPMLLLMDRSDR